MKYKILLVDDEPDILEFVRYNLVREGFEVLTASNGEEGIRMAIEHRPHLILLDRMMPVMGGDQACRTIRSNEAIKDTMIVFLSALGEEEEQLKGFEQGADDYISKPIAMRLLVSRVHALIKRVGEQQQKGQSGEGGLFIDVDRYVVTYDGEELMLPRKEFALLALLYSDPNKLFSREEIYSKVWGSEVVVGDRTIDVHVRKLRKKIGEKHIVTVKGVGYKYEP